MKSLIKSAALLAILLCLAFSSAQAQKKKTTTKKTTNDAANAVSTTNTDVKDEAQKVSIQIKNISKFIYNLAGIARSIEDLDADIKAGKASQKGIDINAKNKQAVMSGLRNISAGLATLETEFRTKPALRAYLLKIEGITALCGQSEDYASAGQFIDSGKPLLTLIEKLTDTLEAM
jgi:archaellum component FlaC